MIDLHIHILPGLDDGPADSRESLDMARHAVAGGIKEVVATPHVAPGLYNNSRDGILNALQEFRAQLQAHDIPLEVHPGAEYLLEPNLPQLIKEGKLLTLGDGGRYLLVEFPAAEIPIFAGQTFFELALQGITPVLAHPERNGELQRNPHKLLPFVERGVLCQGTAGSFTGKFGSLVRQVACHYLQSGCYHFIGTDAHGAVNRKPELQAACAVIDGYSANAAGQLAVENPERLLRGQAPIRLPSMPDADKQHGKSFWSGLWRKITSK